jgi:hypothetical protein|tara:strand:+ start:441 stop:593 length:153 start_codon:yes stop_codon:yes gene_type:complete
MEFSENFRLAQELLNNFPYPKNIREQLDKLREKIPEKELEFFDEFYDTFE